MRYRSIPGTDIQLSEIGFGTGGNAGLMIRGERSEQIRTIARALELGITYFDTAPDYGDGAAETALGRALRAIGGPRPIITTKVEIRREDLGDIAGHVVQSAQASLRRLELDRVDVLQIHNGPTPDMPAMEGGNYHHLWIDHFLGADGVVEGIRRLLADGSIGVAGFVCRGNDAREATRLLETGLFRLLNLPYSLLNPSPGEPLPPGLTGEPDYGEVLTIAAGHGCGAAIFSPLAGGLLAGDAPGHALSRSRTSSRNRQAVIDRLGFLATEPGETLARAAYRFILANPNVTTVIGGFSSVEQLEEIASVSDAPPLSPGDHDRIRAAWAMQADRVSA